MRFSELLGYMTEREFIRLAKEQGEPQDAWTANPILQEYKFTNIRREHDRTSRWLIKNWYQPNREDDPSTILINCAIARWTGTIDFFRAIGWSEYGAVDWERIRRTGHERIARGEKVFTGAYVITNSGHTGPKIDYVIDHVLKPLHDGMEHILNAAVSCEWRLVAGALSQFEGFGGSGFMTKEVLCDTTYTNFWNYGMPPSETGFSYPDDWKRWTPIGPGARRGAGRMLFEDYDVSVKMPEARARAIIIEILAKLADTNSFKDLAAHDVQFVLCEFDKYERVRLGQGRPRSKYRRTVE